MRSGVALLDDWLGGLRTGGVHLLTGGPGSGKSTVALHFADAALRHGDGVAMLVHAHADDVIAHANFLGMNLKPALRDDRLMLLRYRSDFAHRAARSVAPESIVADLERLVAPHRPARIIVDTFSPFVAGPPPLAPIVAALADMLNRLGSSAMLTFPEDLAMGYDRSLEPLVHDAAALIRLVNEGGDIRRAELVTLRYPPPASPTTRFVIREGSGIVAEQPVRSERYTHRVP